MMIELKFVMSTCWLDNSILVFLDTTKSIVLPLVDNTNV